MGYNFGKIKAFDNKVGLNANLVVNNVFAFTNYSGLDPEIGGGIDNNIYPRPRMYSLNLTFEVNKILVVSGSTISGLTEATL